MKPALLIALILLCSVVRRQHTFAQGESAVPFLLIHSSPETNGWGNVGTAVLSDNPIATIANPAQLGVFSLHGLVSVASYAPTTQWLPRFNQPDLTYHVWAVNAGYELSHELGLPFHVGIGAGYARIDLNLGEFTRISPSGPDPIGRFRAFESSEQFSVGFGAEYILKFGAGWSFEYINSHLGPPTGMEGVGGSAKASATDFGLVIQAPLFDILKRTGLDPVHIVPDVEPLFDITMGYARSNVSDRGALYPNTSITDPLPRNVTIGVSVEMGFVTDVDGQGWKIATFSLAREAEDLLIVRSSNGRFNYQSGLGDISFFKHVLRGQLGDNERPNLHKGWQVGFGELVYVRGGSFTESPNFGNRNYTTNGFGFHLGGLLKLIRAVEPGMPVGDIFSFLADHIDLRYDHAAYDTEGPLGGVTFDALNVIVR